MNYNPARGSAVEIMDRYLDKLKVIIGKDVKYNLSVFSSADHTMTQCYTKENNNHDMNVFRHGMHYVWLGDDYKYGASDGVIVASFKLDQLHGCCGVCVSSGAQVHQHHGKGIGGLMNQLRIEMARNMGYGLLLATDVIANAPQRKILTRNGWTDTYKFRNPRTSNDIAVSVIDLWENPFISKFTPAK